MPVYQRILIILVCTLTLFTKSYGQVFKNLKEVNGVPLSSTLGITQDKQGFMWFGTEAGLYRYNSKTFNRYHNGKQNNPKFIRDLTTDSQGNIWVASIRSGLYLFEPDTDTFTNFELDSTTVNSLSHNSVNCVIVDRKNQVWAGTQHGLSRIIKNEGKFRITRHLQTEFSGQTQQIRSLTEDKSGNIWMATGDGLIKMRNDGSNPKLYRIPSLKPQIQLSEFISVYADNNGTIWLGSNATGLYQFNPVTENFKLIETLKTPNGEFPRVSKIIPDGRGSYWMATSLGLFHFDPLTQHTEWYANRPGDPNSLGNTMLFSLYLDRQGGLWCGSFYAGISYLHFDSPRFKSWPFSTDDLRNRSFTNAWLGKGKAKQIWTISDNMDKILVFDMHGKNPSTYNLEFSKEADYYGVYLDENDVLWAAGNAVLTSVNLRTGSYQHYPLIIEGQSAPVNARTFAILKDSHQRFWIGGYYGLLLFDQKQRKFFKQPSPIDNIRSIYEDSRNHIWIGGSNEIYRVNAKNGSSPTPTFEKISIGPKTAEYFWRITKDPSGNIWAAGTTSLFQYNLKNNRFEPNADVPGGSIKDVVPDGQGYLWLNATDKLYRYHPKKRTLQSYSYADGLPQNGLLTQGFGTADASKNLYFMTNQGMFSLDPTAIVMNDGTPPIVLTSLKLYNKEVTTGDSTGLLTEPLWKTKEITFRHDQSIFTIDFSLLSYVRSDLNQYAYKIDGIDPDWNYVQNPSATYTNVPSGTYTFQVKASNGDGFWMKKPLTVKITVLPPWWKSWYAYLFYFLATGGAIYAINRFFWLRTSFRKENALNQIKLDFFTNVSHEIRTHLSLISGPLEKAHQHSGTDKTIGRYLTYARNNSDQLMLLVNELLDFRKIQNGTSTLRVAEHDVVRVIKTVVASFEHLGKEKNIETSVLSSERDVMLWFDISQMQKVFYNLLSNAYKFTPAGGKITVRISELSNEVNITVEDNGKGMSQEHLKKLFTYYYQADSDKPGYGIGLALSKSIVEQHHGYLYAESRESSESASGGTKMTIRLLNKNGHFSPDQIRSKNNDYVNTVLSPSQEIQADESITANADMPTLLIVEDNDELRAFIKELFIARYQILEAENGLRGLELANEHLPEIILCDVMMPEMNGTEVCNHLKKNILTSHIPVVLLTARTQNEQVIEGLTSGADDYVFKPFDPRILELKISNLVRIRKELKRRYQETLLTETNQVNHIAHDINDAFISKLRGIVTQHVSTADFGVNELASEIGMSVSVLYRKLKSLTDMTVNEFIKNIRLNEARKFLESGVYQVNEVATIVGFDDSKYFSKEFRKVFGKTPNEVKKQAPL